MCGAFDGRYGNVNNPGIKLNVEAMLLAFPRDTITVGIGTIVPAACHCTSLLMGGRQTNVADAI